MNHNSGGLLTACLDSIFAEHAVSSEVIVPDNASTDDGLDRAVAKWGERIEVIHNGDNRGFSWGNNIGIRRARGEYICVLQSGHGGAPRRFARTSALPRRASQGRLCGACKVFNSDGTLQLSCRRMIPSPFDAMARALLLSKIFPRSKRFARYNVTYLDENTAQRVDACTGCCMVARREMLNEIGLLDEGYFIYCEDVDWFQRAKNAGWEVCMFPRRRSITTTRTARNSGRGARLRISIAR